MSDEGSHGLMHWKSGIRTCYFISKFSHIDVKKMIILTSFLSCYTMDMRITFRAGFILYYVADSIS